MNREEALHIFSHSEEIVSAADVNASIARMASAIRAQVSEDFPLLLSVMGGAAVFTGMLLPHLDFPLEFDYIHLTRYRNTTKGGSRHAMARRAGRIGKRSRGARARRYPRRRRNDGRDPRPHSRDGREALLERGAVRKTFRKPKPLRPDFCGFEVPDRYVFGCGMDAKGYWRNLPTIRALTEGA